MGLRRFTDSRWFALADLLLVLVCAGVCMLEPRAGKWIILAALLPWGARLAAGRFPFRRTPFDWMIVVFLATAWVGYWAAYNQSTAWSKAWWVTAAVFLYYALASQPKQNLPWAASLFFCVGVGVSVHYLLAYDFVAAPRKLELVNRVGRWLMEVRPQTDWQSIHPNYAAGLAAITAPFVAFPLWEWRRSPPTLKVLFRLFAAAGLGIILLTILMTTSRGVVMALAVGLGLLPLWGLTHLITTRGRVVQEFLFPAFVMAALFGLATFLFLGPGSQGSIAENYHFGNGSRAELFTRSLALFGDYPLTGGGLGSFPGLYSRYILNIPYYNVPNSHNLFLDVGIEQGGFGGLAFLMLYLAGIWRLAAVIVQERKNGSLLAWIILFALTAAFIHGMVDDYLYNGKGTLLALVLPAFSLSLTVDTASQRSFRLDRRTAGVILLCLALLLVGFPKKLLAAWYANIGAVRMSRTELNGFPNIGWAGPEAAAPLGEAEAALHTSLQLDPNNRTANQRLGMISMLRQDFDPAASYLLAASHASPEHRGVMKSLGFSRAWLGDFTGAKVILDRIPEAREELDAYIWWWGTQARPDFSLNAEIMLQALKNSAPEP